MERRLERRRVFGFRDCKVSKLRVEACSVMVSRMLETSPILRPENEPNMAASAISARAQHAVHSRSRTLLQTPST